MSNQKWNRLDQIFEDGQCGMSCEYYSFSYETEQGTWRECYLLERGGDPEFCPMWDSLFPFDEEELESLAQDSYIQAIEEDFSDE